MIDSGRAIRGGDTVGFRRGRNHGRSVRLLVQRGKFPRPVEVTEGRTVFEGDAVAQAIERLISDRRSS